LIEVIDLARTDLGLSQLIGLVRQAKALGVDSIVVFAGNNWQLRMTGELRLELAEILRAGNRLSAARSHVEQKHWSGLYHQIRSLLAELGPGDLIVIPAINLADWSWGETRFPPPLLSADVSLGSTWSETLARTRTELLRGRAKAALKLARQLVDRDGGGHPASLELVGRCYAKLGQAALARRWLHDASDSLLFTERHRVPRIRSDSRALLSEVGRISGIPTLDLEHLFSRNSKDRIPGRGLFLDYCHLTEEGIRLTVTTVASRLWEAWTGTPSGTWQRKVLRSAFPRIGDDARADAHLLAAVHNAKWNQPRELVEHHLKIARARSPSAEDKLRQLEELGRAEVPPVFSQAYGTLLEAGPQFRKYLESTAINAMAHDPLFSRRKRLVRGINLLSQSSTGESDSRVFTKVMWRRQAFRFEREGSAGALLKIVFRGLPRAEGNLAIHLNGRPLAKVALGERWQRAKISVAGKRLRNGSNELTLRWPKQAESFDQRRSMQIELAENGLALELSPVFGHLGALVLEAEN
jgi:hypothetical protein